MVFGNLQSRCTHQCLIGLGANLASFLGPPSCTMEAALDRLSGRGIRILACSRWYANPAWPPGSGPEFINGVALVETMLPPDGLLWVLGRVEAGFGRGRLGRQKARQLDLDLLTCGEKAIPAGDRWRRAVIRRCRPRQHLVVPHPELHRRAFVLLPLLEIAPHWRHPVLGSEARQLVRRLDPAEIDQMTPLTEKERYSTRTECWRRRAIPFFGDP